MESGNVVEYDNYYSCNKCGGYTNSIKVKDYCDSIISECETECAKCGHGDYWAYGFFESRNAGLKACLKYTKDNTPF